MKKRIIITSWLPDEAVEGYRSAYDITMPDREKKSFSIDEIAAFGRDHEGLVTIGPGVDSSLIDRMTAVKVIATSSVGFDHIDVKYANSKGVTVVNTPHMVTDPTAELTLSLILDVYRGISFFDRRTRASGDTNKPGFGSALFNFASTPAGKTLGVVGFGRIGREVARKCKSALGMKIIYFNPSRAPEDVERALDARKVDLDTLLKEADCISVNCPYKEDTHHLFGEPEFSKMKPTAYFVNVARGKVMDERALVKALKEHKIAGAGLDVYEDEPQVSKELLAMDNVVLTPHIGTYTLENRLNMADEAIRGLTEVLEGREPDNIVRIK